MIEVSFDQNGFLISLSIKPDTIVKVSIKANQKVKFNSELNTVTSCQISDEVGTVFFFATNSNGDPFAVFCEKLPVFPHIAGESYLKTHIAVFYVTTFS